VDTLNHHHLFHFWTVVREGGVTRASEKLNVSQPTISGQIRELEEALGEKLLARSGRTVVLTDIGRTVYRYADEILGLGRELMAAVKGRPVRPGKLAVGVAMVVPKLVAYQMLEPALDLPEPTQLDCVHAKPDRLLAELAIFGLDVVLADAPAPPTVKVRAYSHLLGECAVSVFGTEPMARAHRKGFPRSLDGAPFLLPSEDSALRISLEEWFEKERVRPRVVGTFEDSALLDAFGQAGAGLFAMPAPIEPVLRRQYRVRAVGKLSSVRQRFYAITVDRKIRNPAVIAISERARALFG
jgi:LysR family transcriptional regulator, transcriptional activator of nhaA